MSLRLVVLDDPDWAARAACRSDLRFTDEHTPVAELKTVCHGCPVRASCLASALVHEERHDVWGGLTFEERALYCPVCGTEKAADALGCTPGHSLLRLAFLIDLELAGDPDVVVAARQRVSARTSESCPLPLGQDHSTASAYRHRGCRCPTSRRAFYAEGRTARASA